MGSSPITGIFAGVLNDYWDEPLIGAELGPNLWVPGSLATVLWLMAWSFLLVGAVVKPAVLAAVLQNGLIVEKAGKSVCDILAQRSSAFEWDAGSGLAWGG
jgi:hypothetical protein